jgi:zinc transport system substrate-binding protein
MVYFARFLGLLLVLLVPPAQALTIVASIPPLAMVAQSLVMADDRVLVLADGKQSAHSFQWLPSQRQVLAQADLVLWVSPSFESWLVKPLAKQNNVLAIQDLNLTNLLPATAAQQQHNHGSYGQGDVWDWHLWMDPSVMQDYVLALRDELIMRKPSGSHWYQEKAEALLQDIATADQEAKQLLQPLQGVPLLVMHDTWRYFFRYYGLVQGARVQATPEQTLGAASVAELERQLQQGKLRCVLREPQFEPRSLVWLRQIAPDLKEALTDPLGSANFPGGYPGWLKQQAFAIAHACR